MTKQEITGWTIVAVVLLILWWLSKYGLSFLHGTVTTEVSTKIGTGPQAQETTPTVTTLPDISGAPCCGGS